MISIIEMILMLMSEMISMMVDMMIAMMQMLLGKIFNPSKSHLGSWLDYLDPFCSCLVHPDPPQLTPPPPPPYPPRRSPPPPFPPPYPPLTCFTDLPHAAWPSGPHASLILTSLRHLGDSLKIGWIYLELLLKTNFHIC